MHVNLELSEREDLGQFLKTVSEASENFLSAILSIEPVGWALYKNATWTACLMELVSLTSEQHIKCCK
jgi:hypothetical protein